MIEGEQFTLKLHHPNWYAVDTNKLTSAKDIAELLTALKMRVSADYENFDKVKKFLIIPEEPKSIEELKQEFDENLNKIIEKFKEKSEHSRKYAEYRFKQSSENQNSRFDFARKYGYFSQPLLFTVGNGIISSAAIESGYSSFVLGTSNGFGVGYWSIAPNIKIYRKTKPNRIVRYFSKLLLDFDWKDE